MSLFHYISLCIMMSARATRIIIIYPSCRLPAKVSRLVTCAARVTEERGWNQSHCGSVVCQDLVLRRLNVYVFITGRDRINQAMNVLNATDGGGGSRDAAWPRRCSVVSRKYFVLPFQTFKSREHGPRLMDSLARVSTQASATERGSHARPPKQTRSTNRARFKS